MYVDVCSFQRARGTGLEFDDLRFEILEWRRKYIDVETLLNLQNATARPVDPDPQLLQKVGAITSFVHIGYIYIYIQKLFE